MVSTYHQKMTSRPQPAMEQRLEKRFELLMTKDESQMLAALAIHDGISKGNVLRNALRTLARRKKVYGS